jgi:hypothetical protein
MTTPILRLPELTPSTAERLLSNQVSNQIEAFFTKVQDFQIGTPPGVIPAHGYKAILDGAPTGIWSAYSNHIVLVVVDIYVFIPPTLILPDQESGINPNIKYRWDGTSWRSILANDDVWSNVSAATYTITPNESLLLTGGAAQALTAPASAPLYSTFKLRGYGSVGYTLTGGTFLSNAVTGTTVDNVGDYSAADFRLIALPDVWILDNPNPTVVIT